MRSVTVELVGLPPSPNRTRESLHWASRAKVDKEWREAAHLLARHELRASGDPPRWTRVQLSAVFYLPDLRRRDPGNLVGSEGFKALVDGLVDAGVMVDDSIEVIREYGPFRFELRRGKPGVAVTISAINYGTRHVDYVEGKPEIWPEEAPGGRLY